MAQRPLTSLRSLLPKVLTRLSATSGDLRTFVPVWIDVVGALTAKHATPIALDGTTLVIRVDSPRWSQALQTQEAEILRGLSERIGEGRITAFLYRSVEPK